jgi:hypothetical protein
MKATNKGKINGFNRDVLRRYKLVSVGIYHKRQNRA